MTLRRVQQKVDYSAVSAVQVKRCGKSAPVLVVTPRACKPHLEQDQVGELGALALFAGKVARG